MKKGCLFVAKVFAQNKVFTATDSFLNRDDQLKPARHLKNIFEQNNISLDTQDICDPSTADIVIYSDLQDERDLPPLSQKSKSVLVINECEVIYKHNWTESTHQRFSKVLTWNSNLWDQKFYLETRFPILLQPQFFNSSFERKKLVTLISANKTSRHPLELYSQRLAGISWFNKYHPEDFDFYGIGWNKYVSRYRKITDLVNSSPFEKYLRPHYRTYQGPVESKFQVLPQYRFALCFENAQMIKGYITEKIFDCFSSGTIPIYWGAPDIADHIPENCYIDFRKFANFESLYTFLKKMTPDQHKQYIESIQHFMQSEQMNPFRYETTNKNILNTAKLIIG